MIASWSTAAFAIWAALYNGVIFFLLVYWQVQLQHQLSVKLVDSVQAIGIAGLVVVPAAFAWLGRRGVLPGTRKPHAKGFEVVPRH